MLQSLLGSRRATAHGRYAVRNATMTPFAAAMGKVQFRIHNAMMEVFFFATSPHNAVISAFSVIRMRMYLGAGKPTETSSRQGVRHLHCIPHSDKPCSARRQLGRLFSDNPKVIDTFSQICALATARPHTQKWMALPVERGVPVAYVLGVHQSHPNLLGVWYGMICGYAVTSAIAFAVAFGRPNCHFEAEKLSRTTIVLDMISVDGSFVKRNSHVRDAVPRAS
ncbi:unnamed protein product [Peronospora farinosa]|uniref:Uncharacterized protein n=1 Tax=Peronospora farinosa TaxID=134698 RepID=A0ABN8C766_9STRA|nr:unnamed protein product [Peronospora farinosa]